MRRTPLIFVVGLALMTARDTTQAQKSKDEPRRPRLDASADTNDSHVYYEYGLEKLERDPEEAADAFYWAARIDPTSADAFYARRCALLLSDKYRFQKYFEEDRRTLQSNEIKRIDSLYFYSLTINPFLYRKLDVRLFAEYIQLWSEEYARRNNLNPGEVRFAVEREISQESSASMRAWQAYGEGRFREALDLYAEAIKRARHKAELRADRGRLFFQLGQADSALAELTLAIDELRKTDKKDLVYVYESKALIEHSIGLVQQRLGHAPAAKEAFSQALQEDLSYFPAHLQLAFIGMNDKDTTTTLSELDLAVQIRPDDPLLHYTYGFALATYGKFEDAQVQLRKAIEVDPSFAAPYYLLGEVLDALGKPSEGLTQYQTFLARASRQDLRRKEAEQRVAIAAKNGL
ncbi:MAG: tetratricopeptide repeat protein [Gemmatimonadaceae bacterium]